MQTGFIWVRYGKIHTRSMNKVWAFSRIPCSLGVCCIFLYRTKNVHRFYFLTRWHKTSNNTVQLQQQECDMGWYNRRLITKTATLIILIIILIIITLFTEGKPNELYSSSALGPSRLTKYEYNMEHIITFIYIYIQFYLLIYPKNMDNGCIRKHPQKTYTDTNETNT